MPQSSHLRARYSAAAVGREIADHSGTRSFAL